MYFKKPLLSFRQNLVFPFSFFWKIEVSESVLPPLSSFATYTTPSPQGKPLAKEGQTSVGSLFPKSYGTSTVQGSS